MLLPPLFGILNDKLILVSEITEPDKSVIALGIVGVVMFAVLPAMLVPWVDTALT